MNAWKMSFFLNFKKFPFQGDMLIFQAGAMNPCWLLLDLFVPLFWAQKFCTFLWLPSDLLDVHDPSHLGPAGDDGLGAFSWSSWYDLWWPSCVMATLSYPSWWFFTNPIEKYERQIESFPIWKVENNLKYLKPPPSFDTFPKLLKYICEVVTVPPFSQTDCCNPLYIWPSRNRCFGMCSTICWK